MLDPDGGPVASFGDQGHLLVDLGGPTDAFYGVTVTSDGSAAMVAGYKGADPEGTAVTYAWDFESDGTVDATTKDASHTFATPGTKTVSLTVRDAGGKARTVTVDIRAYTPVVAEGDLLAYIREAQGKRFLMVLNLGHRPAQFSLQTTGPGQIVVATETDREQHRVTDRLLLTGDDGVVIELDAAG